MYIQVYRRPSFSLFHVMVFSDYSILQAGTSIPPHSITRKRSGSFIFSTSTPTTRSGQTQRHTTSPTPRRSPASISLDILPTTSTSPRIAGRKHSTSSGPPTNRARSSYFPAPNGAATQQQAATTTSYSSTTPQSQSNFPSTETAT